MSPVKIANEISLRLIKLGISENTERARSGGESHLNCPKREAGKDAFAEVVPRSVFVLYDLQHKC